HRGQAIGRIVIGRIGLNMVLVNGTDHDSLTRGPGRDERTFMPGEDRLVYMATRHIIVPADDLAVLRSPRHELLTLQACHPRFFATHRYLVYARLVSVDPRGGKPYRIEASGQAAPA